MDRLDKRFNKLNARNNFDNKIYVLTYKMAQLGDRKGSVYIFILTSSIYFRRTVEDKKYASVKFLKNLISLT